MVKALEMFTKILFNEGLLFKICKTKEELIEHLKEIINNEVESYNKNPK